MNTGELLDQILAREGGYVDHPADKGGPTNHGITLPTLSRYLGRSASLAEIQALDASNARNIYADLYIRRPGFNQIINDHLRALVVDCAVNHGISRATRWLQEAVGVAADGVLGPITAGAVNAADSRAIYCAVLEKRVAFFGAIIVSDYRNRREAVRAARTYEQALTQIERMQAVFAAGWCNRLAEFLQPLKEGLI